MVGEKTGDLSFTGKRKDWFSFSKSLHKVFDEKIMGWAITAGTTLNKFFIQKDTENRVEEEEDKWDVLSQDLESFHEDDIQIYEQQMKKSGTESNCHLTLLTNRKEWLSGMSWLSGN